MRKDQKIKVVDELKEKLGKAKSFVLTDYRGLTHRQMEEIKKTLREVGADFVVTKNTLLKLSFPSSMIHNLSSALSGPTATLLSYQDEIAPLSVLAKFIKVFGLPQIKIGVLENKILSSEEVLKIAALPSREILMTTLVARLKSPIWGLHYSLIWDIRKLTLIFKTLSIRL